MPWVPLSQSDALGQSLVSAFTRAPACRSTDHTPFQYSSKIARSTAPSLQQQTNTRIKLWPGVGQDASLRSNHKHYFFESFIGMSKKYCLSLQYSTIWLQS
jgi:hypothetical protein